MRNAQYIDDSLMREIGNNTQIIEKIFKGLRYDVIELNRRVSPWLYLSPITPKKIKGGYTFRLGLSSPGDVLQS